MISNSIPDIVDYQQNDYCKLTVEEANDKEYASKKATFNPEDSVDIVFNKITNFHNLCTVTGRVGTDDMLIDYAYLIFNRCGVFAYFLMK